MYLIIVVNTDDNNSLKEGQAAVNSPRIAIELDHPMTSGCSRS
jgi:hypothetical protein